MKFAEHVAKENGKRITLSAVGIGGKFYKKSVE